MEIARVTGPTSRLAPLKSAGLGLAPVLCLVPPPTSGQPAGDRSRWIREVAVAISLVARPHNFCYSWANRPSLPRIPLTQVVRPTRYIGGVHVLRHSGALERLKDTCNTQALKDPLGHSAAKMTLCYMTALTREESAKISQQVDFRW